MQQRINFITLGVNDLQTSWKFYESVFGWEPHQLSNDDIHFYDCGNGLMLAIFYKKNLAHDIYGNNETYLTNSPCPFTLAYNLDSEEAVNNLFAELSENKVKIVKNPEKVFWGGYSGYIADPDGYFWEIAYNPFLEKVET